MDSTIFFKNMPTDLEQPRQRPHYTNSPTNVHPPVTNSGKSSKEEKGPAPLHDFNGPIKFYNLASTLHAVARTRGAELINHNVLFAAASLKSASIFLPIACDMSIYSRNFAHFVLLGRDDISRDILKSVNGITKECEIMFHDGRSDFSLTSSDFRMEVSVGGIQPYQQFCPSSGDHNRRIGEEELWFLDGLSDRAATLGRTVIQLPENAERNLMWITLLDSASLSAGIKSRLTLLFMPSHSHLDPS